MNHRGEDSKHEISKRAAFAIISSSVLLLSILALRIADTIQYIHLWILLKAIVKLWPILG